MSGDAQRDHGHSLSDQTRELRKWCAANGYTVAAEEEDGAWSGGDLMRPGLDRVRELVAAGGIDVVVVLFRDRLARGVYAQILIEEFAQHGTRLIALNAQSIDDSPEGELQGGILDVISGWERKKIAERTRRGKLEKARKGNVIASRTPPYGFRLSAERKTYEVDEATMPAVWRIFELVAVGASVTSVPRILADEGYPPPEGKRWGRRFARSVILDDVYKPHDSSDLEALVAEGLLDKEVAQRTTTPCGVWWFNRNRRVTYKEPDLDGGYRKRSHTEERPRNEWIAVPIAGASIPREWVVAAREAIKDNRVPSRAGDRFFELSGGILYCGGCGRPMVAYNTYAGRREKRLYHYYRCPTVASYGRAACLAKKVLVRAEPLEARVWQMVSAVGADAAWEELLRHTFAPKVDFYRRATSDLSSRVRLTERLNKLTAKRARVLDQQSEGLITMDELKSALAVIEEERTALQDELSALDNAEGTWSQLLSMWDDLLERSQSGFFESAITTPEQRHNTYRDMNLHVELDDDGNPVISGALDHLFSQEGSIRR